MVWGTVEGKVGNNLGYSLLRDLSKDLLIQVCRELNRKVAREMGVGYPERVS